MRPEGESKLKPRSVATTRLSSSGISATHRVWGDTAPFCWALATGKHVRTKSPASTVRIKGMRFTAALGITDFIIIAPESSIWPR